MFGRDADITVVTDSRVPTLVRNAITAVRAAALAGHDSPLPLLARITAGTDAIGGAYHCSTLHVDLAGRGRTTHSFTGTDLRLDAVPRDAVDAWTAAEPLARSLARSRALAAAFASGLSGMPDEFWSVGGEWAAAAVLTHLDDVVTALADGITPAGVAGDVLGMDTGDDLIAHVGTVMAVALLASRLRGGSLTTPTPMSVTVTHRTPPAVGCDRCEHPRRRRMSEIWSVHTSIDEIDASEWDTVVRASGGSAFHTHAWLRAYEYAPPAPLHHVRHLTMRRDGQLRVVAPFYEASDDPHYTGYGADYGFDHPILWTRMLVGHSWYSYYNGICSLDPAPRIAPGLVDRMQVVATELGVPIYGFPGIPQDDPLCRELHSLGFGHVYTEATSRLQVRGAFDDHLAGMRSKTRREFRRLAHKATKLGAVVRTDVRSGDVAAFARLVEDVCTRHGCPTVNPPHSLESVFAQLGGQARFLSLWHGETLLGGFVLLHVDHVLYAWIAGLDYDRHKEYGTYYALYWRTMELAWQLGVRRLEMGRSMYGFKVRMGLHPQPLVSMFRAATPEGEELLRTGLVALDDACRTRERIVTAYRDNGAEHPEGLLGPLPSWATASRGVPTPHVQVVTRA